MIQKQQIAVGGAIFNQYQEVLFVKRSANDDFMPGIWELPGGGTEFGETPQLGLQREVMEECGIEIIVHNPVAVSDYYQEKNDEKVQRVEIVFICSLSSNAQKVVLSD